MPKSFRKSVIVVYRLLLGSYEGLREGDASLRIAVTDQHCSKFSTAMPRQARKPASYRMHRARS
jgi:hypothetical protein